MLSNPDAHFRSSDSNWADAEYHGKGRTLDIIVGNFELYKLRCDAPSATLVRTTPMSWVNVFAWPSYLTNPKWSIPYAPANPAIGYYFPAVTMRHCYNDVRLPGEFALAEKRTRHFLEGLRNGI